VGGESHGAFPRFPAAFGGTAVPLPHATDEHEQEEVDQRQEDDQDVEHGHVPEQQKTIVT